MTSDRPTIEDERSTRETTPMVYPWWDVARPTDEDRNSIQPSDGLYWPEEETT
jgi:hypothetical protein